MGGSDDHARRTLSLPWTVRVQLAALVLAHRRDSSVRHLLFSLDDLKSGAALPPEHLGGALRRRYHQRLPRPVGARLLPLARRERGRRAGPRSRRRLLPRRFPAAYDDGVAALRYLDANVDSLPAAHVPVNLSSYLLAGDSAGGNITHHVSQRWAAASASLPANLRIAGAVLIQPFFGGEERTAAAVALDGVSALSVAGTDHYWREFLPEGATRDHEAARLCGEGVELADALAMPQAVSTGRGGRCWLCPRRFPPARPRTCWRGCRS